MKRKKAEAKAAAIMTEVHAALNERRAPRVDADALGDWVVTVERMFQAGELDAVEHAVRHLHAAYPRMDFPRNMRRLFDRLPPCDGQLPFHDDRQADVQIVPRDGADTVILLFCGFSGQLGLPLPVLHRWFGKLPAHLVYLRDFRRLYYLNGIRSVGPDRQATLKGLRRIVDRLQARRVVCYGNSGGVFAAVHYGLALSADTIVCLSGSTNLTPEFTAHSKRPDSRAHFVTDADVELDLRRTIEAAERPARTLLLFAANNWDDRIQAENLANLSSVTLQAVPDCGQHNVIVDLIHRGAFEPVLAWLIQSRDEQAPAEASTWKAPPEFLPRPSGFRRIRALLGQRGEP